MNLMEEIPDQTPQPMVFSKAVVVNKENQNTTNMPALGFFDLDLKMMLIVILLIIVVLTYYGINLLLIGGNVVQSVVQFMFPAVNSFLDILGDSTGNAINKISDVSAQVAKTGVDIADGTVHNVGNLLIGEEAIGTGPNHKRRREPQPDVPEDSIQKSLASAKTKWCLVGEYQNKRGCIDISESDKCMSGEVFPNEEMCKSGRPQFQNNA